MWRPAAAAAATEAAGPQITAWKILFRGASVCRRENRRRGRRRRKKMAPGRVRLLRSPFRLGEGEGRERPYVIATREYLVGEKGAHVAAGTLFITKLLLLLVHTYE